MFGRKKTKEPTARGDRAPGEPVAAALELDLARVEESVDAYLAAPSEHGRAELVRVLGLLDEETAAADAYANHWAPGNRYGGSGRSHALGATSDTSAVEEVSVSEFDAQVALVRAAKQAVLHPDTANLAALRSAAEVVAGLGDQGEP